MTARQSLTKKTRIGRPRTPEAIAARYKIFFEMLAQHGSPTHACRAVGLSRTTVYDLQKANPDFAARWADAMEEYIDVLKREAHRRAVEGVVEPVYQQKELVGTITRYSDQLLLAQLRAKSPEYRNSQPTQVVAVQQRKESDPIKLARKIAFALAIAKKSEEQKQ